MISLLQGTAPAERLIVDRQTCSDIIRQICSKHRECTPHYDRIASFFDDGDTFDICRSLWKFCKNNLRYVEEDTERQYTSCPYTILTGGAVDCKNYALFIAGVLDALKRRGRRIHWQFRFVSYYFLDPTPGHVFVVVNPSTNDIWIDPVLSTFNDHLFYWYHRNRSPKTESVGRIGYVPAKMGTTDAENKLLSEVLEYQQGLIGAMGQTLSTSTFNNITTGVLQGVSMAIPGAGAALSALKALTVPIDNAFGVGSAAARLLTDLSSLNLTGLWNDLWGRTYNTDQYWGAVYYKFYVLGQNITDINQVADSDVLPALKWFIDRTGVFISGREHIIALTQSPAAYMNYHSVNGDTTTDTTLVNAAYQVAKTYWTQPGNFNPSLMGAWKNTVGVYDRGLIQLANKYGMTPEQYVAYTGTADQVAQQSIDQATEIIPGIPDLVLYAGFGLLLVLGLSKN